MLEDKKCKSIIELLNDNFDELCYEITKDAESQNEYQDLQYVKKLLLEDYPIINKIELSQTVSIKDDDIKNLKEYHEINNAIKRALMKEAYFRGVKDALLLLVRANIMENK